MNISNHLNYFVVTKVSICFTVFAIFCSSSSHAVLTIFDLMKAEDVVNSKMLLIQSGSGNSEMSHILDKIVLKILKAPTGQVFCQAISENEFKSELFINNQYISEGLRLCKDQFKSEDTLHSRNYKSYTFVIGNTPNLNRLDGWTDFQDHTYLFFSDEKEFTNEDRLIRTLAHEMAISYDTKDLIGFAGRIEAKGIPIVHDEQSCKLTQILGRADIRHALKSIRAFDIEKRIADELSIQLPLGFANWGTKSCGEKIKFMFSQMLSLKNIIDLNAKRTEALYDQPDCRSADVNNLSTDELIANFEKININFRDGSSMKACDYFTQGWPYIPGRSLNGGPGPRIGGGAWRSLNEPSGE